MRTVLLGDSHLARVRRDLGRLATDVVDVAVGGATAEELLHQARSVPVGADDAVVVSIGTNDAAPRRAVPKPVYADALERFLDSVRPARLVLLTSPGVVESRLSWPRDRTSRMVAEYAMIAGRLFRGAGAVVVEGSTVVAPLDDAAFAPDGLHLSGAGYDLLLSAIGAALSSAV